MDVSDVDVLEIHAASIFRVDTEDGCGIVHHHVV
jgi:hypothetical protein